MLIAIALVLLAATFPFWAGVPFFLVGSFVADISFNYGFVYTSIGLSGGFLFSIYFVPFNLKVARKIASVRNCSVAKAFMYIQAVWIIVCSFVFGATLLVIYFLEK